MSGNNKNLIVTILAVIGAIVVAGWVLKATFSLLGPLIVVGIAVVVYMMFAKNKGSGL